MFNSLLLSCHVFYIGYQYRLQSHLLVTFTLIVLEEHVATRYVPLIRNSLLLSQVSPNHITTIYSYVRITFSFSYQPLRTFP